MSVVEKFFYEEQFSEVDPKADPDDICGNSNGWQKKASLEIKDDNTFNATEYYTSYSAGSRSRNQKNVTYQGTWENSSPSSRKFTITNCKSAVFPHPVTGDEHHGKTFEVANGAPEVTSNIITGMTMKKVQ